MPPNHPGIRDKSKGEEHGPANGLERMEVVLENTATAAIKFKHRDGLRIPAAYFVYMSICISRSNVSLHICSH